MGSPARPHRGIAAPDKGTSAPGPFGPEDIRLFYDSIEGLLAYANTRLGIVRSGKPALRGPLPSKEHRRELAMLLDTLWSEPELIDGYAAENPDGLGPHTLEVVQGWRYAYSSAFICVDAKPQSLLVMDETRVFEVSALQSAADAHIDSVPCLLVLTLLPFLGRIVTDSRITNISDSVGPGALGDVADLLERAMRLPVIDSASALAGYVSDIEREA